MGKQILKFCECSSGLLRGDTEGIVWSRNRVNRGSDEKVTLFCTIAKQSQPFPPLISGETLQGVT